MKAIDRDHGNYALRGWVDADIVLTGTQAMLDHKRKEVAGE